MLVPFVKTFYTRKQNLEWYRQKLLRNYDALQPEQIDALIQTRERALLEAAKSEPIDLKPEVAPLAPLKLRKARKSARASIFANIKELP